MPQEPAIAESVGSHDSAVAVAVAVPTGGTLRQRVRSWPAGQRLVRSRVVQAGSWTVAGGAAKAALRLGSNLILTRLLFPEAFGLMALVAVFVQFLALFSDIGIGPSLIQSKRGEDPDFVNTAWTIQVARGLLLWAAACLVAWPIALVYGQPMLAQLLPVAAISAAIAGFNSTRLFTTIRHLALGRRTMIELAGQVVSIVVVIVLAWATRSVWALVAGHVVGPLVLMVLSHRVLPGAGNSFRWHRESARELYRFGRWIFLTTMLTYLGTRGDRLLLGAQLKMAQFGVFSIAVLIAEASQQLFLQLGQKVFLPKFSQIVRERPAEVSRRYYQVRLVQDAVSLSLAGLLFSLGDVAIALLYDSRYEAAGRMLQILSVRVAFGVICQLSAKLVVAMGKPHLNAIASGLRTALLFAFVPLILMRWGLEEALWTLVGIEVVAYLYYGAVLYSLGVLRLRRELLAIACFAGGCLLGRACLLLA